MALLTARDSQGNTIAHLVAASGNTEVFKVQYLQYIGMEGNMSIVVRCDSKRFCCCGKRYPQLARLF